MSHDQSPAPHDPFAALRIREFSLFISARFFLTLGIQMQSVILGWQVYRLTKDVLILGYIGLAEAIPFIIVSFFSGHVADIISRKKIILAATTGLVIATALLSWISSDLSRIIPRFGISPIFCIVVLTGIIRAFLGPSFPSFMSQLIPRSHYTNSATWNSTIWHAGFIAGNALGGILCRFEFQNAYAIDVCVICISMIFISFIGSKPLPPKIRSETLIESLSAGLNFVFKNKVIRGVLSLDLFAVLFGGAVAMLPAFADKILKVGAIEFGMLRAAPAAGAVAMAFLLAYRPQKSHAGRNLLLSIAGFGICTLLFGLSENYYLSLFLLALTGAFDNVSVVIRHSILQLMTPDSMRGRVSAVNNIFIGSSNEIGAFESGVTARLMGLTTSVIFGGAMTMFIVMFTARISPSIRKVNLKALESAA